MTSISSEYKLPEKQAALPLQATAAWEKTSF